MTRASTTYPSGRVTLREVGLRDGLQLTTRFPSTEAKKRWLAQERAAGVRHFEVGSFLPPSRFPQFSDVREIVKEAATSDIFSTALVLNDRGARDAIETTVNEIVVVVSATEEHSLANMNKSRAEALEFLRRTRALADASAEGPMVSVGISMAFGCSIAGNVETVEVLRLIGKSLEGGAEVISIADTVGFAGPRQVEALTDLAVRECGDTPVVVHLHDTRGMGMANAAAAMNSGARVLDGSLGGLGGCPFAPGATGNAVFEDLVFLCERMGFSTGIDVDALCATRSILAEEMPEEKLFGSIARAGPPSMISWAA